MSDSEVKVSGGSVPRVASTAGSPLREWLAPLAFGVLVFVVICTTSASPQRTLPALTWSLFAGAALLLAAMRISGRRLQVSGGLAGLLLALSVSLAVSTAYSPLLLPSLPRLGFYLVLVLIAAGVYLAYRDARSVPLHAYCVAMAAVHVPFVIGVVTWMVQSGAAGVLQMSPRVPYFSHVRQFGEAGFLAASCGSALIPLMKRYGVPAFALTSIALFGIISTGSRGALLCWMVFIILLAIFSPERKRVAAHGLAALAAAAVALWVSHSAGWLESPNIVARLGQVADGSQQFDSGRLQIWLQSLRLVAEHPLFGLGSEAYLYSRCCDPTVSQPHNLVLQLLMQFGLVGSTLLAALGWRAVHALGGLRRMLRLTRSSPQTLVLGAMLAAYLAYCMIDGLLYHPLPLIHFALFCGLFAAGLRQARVRGE